jgi:hypothetical protein
MTTQDQIISERLREWKRNFFQPGKSWNDLDTIISDLQHYEEQANRLAGKVLQACSDHNDKNEQVAVEAALTKG